VILGVQGGGFLEGEQTRVGKKGGTCYSLLLSNKQTPGRGHGLLTWERKRSTTARFSFIKKKVEGVTEKRTQIMSG